MAKKKSGNQGVMLAIKQAGDGGITTKELKDISKSTGVSAATVIKRLDKVNTNLKAKEAPAIALNSGAANMLIKQNEKQSGYDAYLSMLGGKPQYGSGQIGKTLQSMMSSPGIPTRGGGTMGGTAGFNPGGNPTKNRMVGGTQIRGGGNIANQGFGSQYELPKTVVTNPIDLDTGRTKPEATDPGVQEPVPMTPEEMKDASTVGSGMLSGGGLGATGASKLNRAKSRLRKLGI
jgi:hypothetical protein